MTSLPVGGVSAPVVSRFGVHLIQVMERRSVALDTKQLREQARNALRERKFEQAYGEWVREVRDRAYVEFRERRSERRRSGVKHQPRKRFGQHFLADPASSTTSSRRSTRGPARRWSRSAPGSAR